ncbi:MAG: hypothetical protein LUD72_08605 [Bacteroidales bacterium]|nr:hypothetical protein [Bacteroidales bacterium]
MKQQNMVREGIYHYIDSNAIRMYLKTINYSFSALEAAYLIHRCGRVTLDEKFDGWKAIISAFPDCPVKVSREDFFFMDSLHRFLEEYMDLQKQLIEEFYADDDGVYMTLCNKSCMFSAEESIERSKREVHLSAPRKYENKFWIHKVYPASEEGKDHITMYFNMDGDVLSVSGYSAAYSMNLDEFDCVFCDQWYSFPTPFHRGDLLMGHWEKVPFLLNYMDTWDLDEMKENGVYKLDFDVKRRRKFLVESGTTRGMNAVVYRVNEIGKLYQSVLATYDNYLDLEYYDGELTGPKETLALLRDLMQRRLNITEFLDKYEQILVKETYNHLYGMSNGDFPDHELDEQVHRDEFNVYMSFLKEQV